MDINATLLGQMITFAVFVIFTMKYVWPPITKAMDEREKKIADGLVAADRGEHNLQLAQQKSIELIQEAKVTATQIVDHANSRAAHLLEEAQKAARLESDKIIAQAQVEITQQVHAAKRQLHNQVADLALVMAEKIVQHDIDPAMHKKLLDKLVADVL